MEMWIFLAVVGVLWAMFWGSQLLDLMQQRDEAFPGRWNKPLWVGIVVLMPVLGALLYWMQRPVRVKAPGALEREWRRMQQERPNGGNAETIDEGG